MKRTPEHVDVLLVCSTGGHLLQLVALRGAWSDAKRAWITFDKSDARSLLADEQVVFRLRADQPEPREPVQEPRLAFRLLRRFRPRVIVTTGAGVAVPFCWIGRLLGARVVYVESLSRITSPSLSYRLIAPDREPPVLPVARVRGRRASRPVCRQRLLPLMIFVTVGTNEARFDRLLQAVESFDGSDEIVVQHGPSPVRPRGATCVDYLSFEEMTEHIRRARVLIMHAGVGSVLAALGNGARPLVVPRLKRFDEAVDDHQVAFGRRLHEEGLVEFVEDPAGLVEAAARYEGSFAGQVGSKAASSRSCASSSAQPAGERRPARNTSQTSRTRLSNSNHARKREKPGLFGLFSRSSAS